MTALLVLNAGSSSLKFGLYRVQRPEPQPLARGEIKGLGSRAEFWASSAGGPRETLRRWPEDAQLGHAAALGEILAWLSLAFAREELVAVGHRVVHGGARAAPAAIDGALLDELEALVPLAPLHQPHNLAGIRAVEGLHPQLPQVAAFDTAFHRDLAPAAARFALPRRLHDEGVRRYGFHGLSFEYIAGRIGDVAPRLATGRVVVAHLGAGVSLCALRAGRSIDTTMGMTPLDGLPMATRAGALDPGVLLYLLRDRGMTLSALEELLYRQSGWLGVSGISSDMRVLAASEDPRAAEARALVALGVAKGIVGMATTMNGLDGLIFTAGVGTRDAALRAAVVDSLHWLGIALDPAANAAHAQCISRPDSRTPVLVLETDEEIVLARHTQATLGLA